MKKKIVAMLLAGGQGSRLGVLTSHMAKPAVPFGGKYRIIDFPLSNCVNSDIDTVGVLTQYRPLALNSYLGTGQYWDLDRLNGGVFVLPPYMTGSDGQWYSGTANAIYQNREFVDQYDPDYVLILSGDHIYKMDYSRMLQFHIQTGAAATIAVLPVPMEEAHRFGIMNTDDRDNIVSFEEKPAHPKSNKASMGIYIFNWKTLKAYMEKDDADPNSDNDFGKNIIPAMLKAGERMVAYPFEGYWKDVGTVQSLWEANMDLLGDDPVFNLYDDDWRIYSRSEIRPPHYIGMNGKVANSLISQGCEIDGIVENSVLFGGVKVARGAYIRNSIIMQDTVVREGASVYYSIVDGDTEIGAGAVVGEAMEKGGKITLVGFDLKIPHGGVIKAGEMVNAQYLEEHKI